MIESRNWRMLKGDFMEKSPGVNRRQRAAAAHFSGAVAVLFVGLFVASGCGD